MLNEQDLADLLAASHADPFARLGLHTESDGRLWLRVFLPGAVSVDVLDANTGKKITALGLRHADGLFEAAIPRRRNRFDYRLRIDWGHSKTEMADAFAFGPQLTEQDLQQLQSGLHPEPYGVLGAQPLTIHQVSGVRFAVWAPNAKRVSVVGSFNVWDGRRHPMRLRHGAGVWEIFIPHAAVGDLYQFEILDAQGHLLPHKADPYARSAELRPGKASRVSAMPTATPLSLERVAANRHDAAISVYEVHAGSWKRRADGGFLSWDELAETLPAYVASLGFTHVQLMPITEHPFDGSWGYQTLGLFAPSARFGEPEGFGRFVAACHRHGLGILLDWVPAHFPVDAHGLARFDGSALYEYEDPREGWHHDWNTAIYNFGRHEVRNFLVASARYWIERWGVDGLRVDAVASMLYRDYSRKAGQWLPNAHGGRENLEAISLFQRLNTEIGANSGALTIAEESTAFPGVTTPVHNGGLGFHFKWNMGWMNDSLRYMQEDPIHRRWHHDKITFSLVYAFSENFMLPLSHDEVVHGKSALIGKMPGDAWQRFANLRAYYGFMWGHPGKKLLFMGQEFAQLNEWQHDGELPWNLLQETAHAGVQLLIHDLNQLYRACPAMHSKDCEPDGFQWLNGGDAENSVLSWLRKGDKGEQVLVLSNFTPVPREGYRVGLPDEAPKRWKEALNTDSRHYGGSDMGNTDGVLHVERIAENGHAHSLAITVPPLCTVFLVPAT